MMMTRGTQAVILLAVTFASAAAISLAPPIPQDPAYHRFADTRPVGMVPNGWNVLSNLAFLLVGGYGVLKVLRMPAGPTTGLIESRERWPYALFFAGVALTGVSSAYYHWAPDTSRLFWDRLPMTIGFMAFLAAVVSERIGVTAGLLLLGPLVAAGAGSVIFWRAGELEEAGDLRPYALVQFLPALLILLMLWLGPARYTGGGYLLVVLGIYAVAKLFEALDGAIFSLGHWLSGHTLKHLAVALASGWVVHALETRHAMAVEEQT